MVCLGLIACGGTSNAALAQDLPAQQSAEVIAAMQKVHAGFAGQKGYVAQLGDSITYSMAFWSPLGWDDPTKYLPEGEQAAKLPENKPWKNIIQGTRDKGPEFANYSGWKVGQVLKALDGVLEKSRPEVAIIMVGTNDISGGKVPAGYRDELEQLVKQCTAAHCVPILNTIPPRRNHEQVVGEINKIIQEVAGKSQVPLVDFHAECVRRWPEKTWDGTIISSDGVHPSGGKSNDYSPENLKNSGYALRNWLNFLAYRQLYFEVLSPVSEK